MHLRNEILIYFLKILVVFGCLCCGDHKVSEVECLVISTSTVETVIGFERELDSTSIQPTARDDGESATIIFRNLS